MEHPHRISEQQVGKSALKSRQKIGQCHKIPTKNGWNGWSVGYLHDNNDNNGTSPWLSLGHPNHRLWDEAREGADAPCQAAEPAGHGQVEKVSCFLVYISVSPNPHGLEVGLFFQKYLEKCDDLGQTANYWEISIVWDRGIEKGSGIGDLRRISTTMPQIEI